MIQLNRQQTIILQALRQAGNYGINSYDLRFKFHLIQAPVRIKELKEKGFLITTRDKKDRSVDYILMLEPHDDVLLYTRLTAKVAQDDKKVYAVFNMENNTARRVSKEEYERIHAPKQEVLL